MARAHRAPPSTAARGTARISRVLASPAGVLITLPLLVLAVGVGILVLGRDATRGSSRTMASHQLAEQVQAVQAELDYALDQADPLLARLAVLADPARPADDVLPRLYDLIVGRPGVAFVSVSFPDGTFRGAQLVPGGAIEVQESRPGERVRYAVAGGALHELARQPTDYDPRRRDFYLRAVRAGARVWTEPYTFYESHETGITCAEPLYDGAHALRAVLTVDFHVEALSRYLARPALDGAHAVVYTRGGIVLADPAAAAPARAAAGDRLLHLEDLHDPAADALRAQPAPDHPVTLELATRDGAYLAAIAPIGGTRAGVAVPLDWFVASVVPEHALLGPTRRLERRSIVASAAALALASALALVLAWNLVRMRRQVAASREQARSAEARARELGSYRLVGRLGTGGMGEVWRAEHRLLARSAAIKLIRPEAVHDHAIDELRARFRREAQVLASMKSRHTIAIYDYGVTADGVFYYVMELLDGLDLEALVVRYGAQPAARVIAMLVQACASLAEAHDAGLYHRDIKPPNLMLCRAAEEVDVVKLLDFGIVQTAQEPAAPIGELDALPDTGKLTQVGAMVGTPGFMAPEQILGLPVDARADLYALGCVAWWLLTGREVFARDGGEPRLFQRHLQEPVPELRAQVRGWLPEALEAAIRSCLAKEPEDRPRDARVLAATLRAIAIPGEHAWTESSAAAWWQAYEPPAPAPAVPSAEVQVIVPGRTGEPRPAATDARALAPTIADRR